MSSLAGDVARQLRDANIHAGSSHRRNLDGDPPFGTVPIVINRPTSGTSTPGTTGGPPPLTLGTDLGPSVEELRANTPPGQPTQFFGEAGTTGLNAPQATDHEVQMQEYTDFANRRDELVALNPSFANAPQGLQQTMVDWDRNPPADRTVSRQDDWVATYNPNPGQGHGNIEWMRYQDTDRGNYGRGFNGNVQHRADQIYNRHMNYWVEEQRFSPTEAREFYNRDVSATVNTMDTISSTVGANEEISTAVGSGMVRGTPNTWYESRTPQQRSEAWERSTGQFEVDPLPRSGLGRANTSPEAVLSGESTETLDTVHGVTQELDSLQRTQMRLRLPR